MAFQLFTIKTGSSPWSLLSSCVRKVVWMTSLSLCSYFRAPRQFNTLFVSS